MNVSKNNYTNITYYGYDLNERVSNIVSMANLLQTMFLLVGVPANCFVLYIYTFKKPKGDRFGVVMSSLVDLTASVFGSACGFAMNTNPVNFYSDSQCAFMLGSNMLLWNLSAVCILNVTTYRYILLRYPSVQLKNRYRQILTVIVMLVAIGFSIPAFIFYGETKVGLRLQNLTVFGKMCGASGILEKGPLFQVYPIVVSVIYTFVFLYLTFIQLRLSVLFYRGLAKMERLPPSFRYGTLAHIKIMDNLKIIDRYANKNFFVIGSDALICKSCEKKSMKITCGTDDRLEKKSAYEMMLDIDIIIPENTNLIDDTSNNLKDSNNPRLKIVSSPRRVTWYLNHALILFFFVYLLIDRAREMFINTSVWSDISKIEWSWGWLCLGNVMYGVLNPFLHSNFLIFDTLKNYLRA
ncbi:uncharacterized protein LOC134691049 [Mytilus trossulus]|uniref:uncharacterized protein LOC134691049 n=1 Tax=Mytilus trossulus TaxID=6551 RepID=UPI003003A988